MYLSHIDKVRDIPWSLRKITCCIGSQILGCKAAHSVQIGCIVSLELKKHHFLNTDTDLT